MPVSSLQAAVIAAVTAIVGLVVGFGIIDESAASQITAAAGTLVGLVFLIANSIIHHGIPGDPSNPGPEGEFELLSTEARENAVTILPDGDDSVHKPVK